MMMRIRIASRIIKDNTLSRWGYNWVMLLNPASPLADELNMSKVDISEVFLFDPTLYLSKFGPNFGKLFKDLNFGTNNFHEHHLGRNQTYSYQVSCSG